MRCSLGEKKLRKYSKMAAVEFVKGMVRGNTNHRVDLFTAAGDEFNMWPGEDKPTMLRERPVPVYDDSLTADIINGIDKCFNNDLAS